MTRRDAIKRINALRAQYDTRKQMNCKTSTQRTYLKQTQKILFQEIENMMIENDIHHSEIGNES